MKVLSNAAKKLKNLVRKEVRFLMLRILRLVSCFVTSHTRHNCLLCGCKKAESKCNEKWKMPTAPVDASTLCFNGKLHFIQTFLEKVLKSLLPSLFLWPNSRFL